MGQRVVGRSRERCDALGAGEVDLKPDRECCHELVGNEGSVGVGHVKLVSACELEVRGAAGPEVCLKDAGRLGYNELRVEPFDRDEAIACLLHTSHLDAVLVVNPNCVILALQALVVKACHTDAGALWEHEASWLEQPVSHAEHGLQHALIEQTVSHPLRNYGICHLLNVDSQHDILSPLLDDRDLV